MLTLCTIALLSVYLGVACLCFFGTGWVERPVRGRLFVLFVMALLLRILASLLVSMLIGRFYPDENFYLQAGLDITTNLKFPYLFPVSRLIRYAGSANIGYPLLNACHVLLYPDPLLCRITNSFLGALLILPVYGLARSLFNQKIAAVAAVLTAFWPNLIYWSAFNLKDIPVAFCIVLILWLYRRCTSQRASVAGVLALALAAAALLGLRIYIGLLLLGVLALHLLIFSVIQRRKKFLILTAVILLCLVLNSSYIADFLQHNASLHTFLQLSARSYSRASEHGYLMGKFSSGNLATLPVSAAHFLLTPSPFRITFNTITDILKCANTLWYALFPFFLIGAYKLARFHFKDTIALLLFIAAVTAVYTFLPFLGMVRHRDQITPLLLMVSAVGLCSPLRHKVGLVWCLWLGLFAAVAALEMKFYFGSF